MKKEWNKRTEMIIIFILLFTGHLNMPDYVCIKLVCK